MILDFSTLPTDFARATAFLTRLPVPAHFFEGHDGSLSRESRAFPFAGLVAALPAALFLLVAPSLNIPLMLSTAIAMAVAIGTTGALHEDGLGDVADGFFGESDKQKRLEIMTDSRLGTYGVLTLTLSLLLKVGALLPILTSSGWQAAAAILAAGVSARTALVWHWSELESARPGGVADRAGKPHEDSTNFALVAGTVLSSLLAGAAFGVSAAILTGLLVCISAIAFVRLCRDKIGGFTGDTLGASAQIAETAALIALACSL